jgi:hypothetical protein
MVPVHAFPLIAVSLPEKAKGEFVAAANGRLTRQPPEPEPILVAVMVTVK